MGRWDVDCHGAWWTAVGLVCAATIGLAGWDGSLSQSYDKF